MTGAGSEAALLGEVFIDLPRAGPGDDATTRAALARVPGLPPSPRLADLGCGQGAQTRVLAQALPRARILAIDLLPPFLDRLTRWAAAAGFSDRIETRCADITAMDLPADGFDLIWSEGAIYIAGYAAGLSRWRPWVRDGGSIVVSDLVWRVAAPPRPAVDFFQAMLPDMTDRSGRMAGAEAAGFRVVATLPLPAAGWWDNYYAPLAQRIDALAADASPAMTAVLDACAQEIDVWRAYGDSYGYEFFVLQRQD